MYLIYTINKCQLISQSVTIYTVHIEHPTLNKCLKMKIPFPLPAKCKPIITMDRQLLTLMQNNYDSWATCSGPDHLVQGHTYMQWPARTGIGRYWGYFLSSWLYRMQIDLNSRKIWYDKNFMYNRKALVEYTYYIYYIYKLQFLLAGFL